MTNRSQAIHDYIQLHTLMQGLDRTIALHDADAWKPRSITSAGREAPAGLKTDIVDTVTHSFHDSLGHARTLMVARDPEDDNEYYAWMSAPGEARVQPKPYHVRHDEKGKLYIEHQGLRILNDRFMYDHQARAVASYAEVPEQTDGKHRTSREVMVFATGTGKSYIIGHTLKATGGQGVVIAPKGLGEQVVKDLCEVMPTGVTIQTGASVEGDTRAVNRALNGYKGVLVIEADDLERFMGTDAAPGWLCQGDTKHVMIDEAHEFTTRSDPSVPPAGKKMLQRIAQHNDVLAVTATPNPDLYDALDIHPAKPIISITMYDAMHRLPERPFRPISLEMKQVGTPMKAAMYAPEEREKIQRDNEPSIRMEALAGYFGREQYLRPDFFRAPEKDWEVRADVNARYQSPDRHRKTQMAYNDAEPVAQDTKDIDTQSIVAAMERNRIRYSMHKNIAFAVRNDLVMNLARDFQAIHDGTFDREQMRQLTQEVWKRRAQSAIAEYIRMGKRTDGFGLPESLEDLAKSKGLGVLTISDKNLDDVGNQEAFREAVRHIEPEDFRAAMPLLFEKIIGKPEDIDLSREAREAQEATRRSALLRQMASSALNISTKEARRLDMTGKLPNRLREAGVDPENLTVSAGPDAPCYYALAVIGDVPGKEKVCDASTGKLLPIDGKEVGDLVNAGRVMHVVNNYRFTTGFSDPDVMMTQRIIENLGDHTVRATQILGRPVREKDGIAAIHEIVGPFVDMKGERGMDRHFSCYDVVAKDYLKRAHEFDENWQRKGQHIWLPSSMMTQAPSVEAMGTAKERGL